ncbi:MAG: hypothetical protein D3910_15450 [Candidatus Electrothrix sp. ATG2]|nr:hypothetical protein [Candidatus Electrothrix sp. ATG2]
MQGLRNKTLAVTTMGNETSTLLDVIILNKLKLTSASLNIITTPKDSDALLALAMGQVDSALVSKNNLQKIGSINPHILELVQPLAESQPIPLPILCLYVGDEMISNNQVIKLKKILLEAQYSSDSANLMEMLQIDAWHNYPF